jgi:SAM-dependent methyltransferase
MPYPAGIAEAIRRELGLDGTGRLLDVGCGPGSLTLLLAPLFEAVVGVDADPGMIAEARRRAAEFAATTAATGAANGAGTIEWRQLRAEDLPADLGIFRVVTFAQSFHWMDQPLIARTVRRMLAEDGAWVHVGATTHRGVDGDDPLPHPRPPWDRIDALVTNYLGPARRAGQGSLPSGTRGGEEEVMRQAGFTGPTRIETGGGQVVQRSTDEIVSSVLSLSSSAPHLFADQREDFEADLGRLLSETSPSGLFSERTREVALVIWRP